MSLRKPLADALTLALPAEWKVTGYTKGLVRVDRLTVAVWTNKIAHLDGAPASAYVVDFTVALYTPHADPTKADDDLETALPKLLDALWSVPDVVLSNADRTTNDDNTLHAWVLTVRQGITITTEPEEG